MAKKKNAGKADDEKHNRPGIESARKPEPRPPGHKLSDKAAIPLLILAVDLKLSRLSDEAKLSYWECVGDCLEAANPNIGRCFAECAAQALGSLLKPSPVVRPTTEAGKLAMMSCILGCGGLAWYEIIGCFWGCKPETEPPDWTKIPNRPVNWR